MSERSRGGERGWGRVDLAGVEDIYGRCAESERAPRPCPKTAPSQKSPPQLSNKFPGHASDCEGKSHRDEHAGLAAGRQAGQGRAASLPVWRGVREGGGQPEWHFTRLDDECGSVAARSLYVVAQNQGPGPCCSLQELAWFGTNWVTLRCARLRWPGRPYDMPHHDEPGGGRDDGPE